MYDSNYSNSNIDKIDNNNIDKNKKQNKKQK